MLNKGDSPIEHQLHGENLGSSQKQTIGLVMPSVYNKVNLSNFVLFVVLTGSSPGMEIWNEGAGLRTELHCENI